VSVFPEKLSQPCHDRCSSSLAHCTDETPIFVLSGDLSPRSCVLLSVKSQCRSLHWSYCGACVLSVHLHVTPCPCAMHVMRALACMCLYGLHGFVVIDVIGWHIIAVYCHAGLPMWIFTWDPSSLLYVQPICMKPQQYYDF
jgi:hypothetical protein